MNFFSFFLFILPLQVGLLEVLVGKIFDLAFMPAMNGERGCPRGAWPGDQEVTGLLGIYDAQLFHLNSIPETFTLSLFISASECKYCPKVPSTSLFAAFVILLSCPTLLYFSDYLCELLIICENYMCAHFRKSREVRKQNITSQRQLIPISGYTSF